MSYQCTYCARTGHQQAHCPSRFTDGLAGWWGRWVGRMACRTRGCSLDHQYDFMLDRDRLRGIYRCRRCERTAVGDPARAR
jgi:hypothetical protein